MRRVRDAQELDLNTPLLPWEKMQSTFMVASTRQVRRYQTPGCSTLRILYGLSSQRQETRPVLDRATLYLPVEELCICTVVMLRLTVRCAEGARASKLLKRTHMLASHNLK